MPEGKWIQFDHLPDDGKKYNKFLPKLKNSDALIHLVGIGKQTIDNDYNQIHIKLTKKIINLCKKSKIKKIIYTSGLGVSKNTSLGYFISKFKAEKFTDNDRFYVGGLSMGAMGTFELLRRKPKAFASAFAICGGDHVENVKKYKKVPLWIFHGGKDTTVPILKSEIVVNELKRLNGNVKFSIYPEAGHNSWDAAFAEPEFLSWLFSFKK